MVLHHTAQHLADDALAKAGNAETCRSQVVHQAKD